MDTDPRDEHLQHVEDPWPRRLVLGVIGLVALSPFALLLYVILNMRRILGVQSPQR